MGRLVIARECMISRPGIELDQIHTRDGSLKDIKLKDE